MKRAEDIFPKLGLRVGWCFECGFCGRQFERDGKKEGFVKAGANKHVFMCWTVGLYLRGYMLGHAPIKGVQQAIPVATIEKRTREGKIHPCYLRAMKAAVAKRRRDGELDRLQP